MTQVVNTISDFRTWQSKQDFPTVAVFTMGALHDGHQKLIKYARQYINEKLSGNGKVVVSIFVNPTQFNNSADLEKYPRDLDADLKICKELQVDVVFAPTAQEMYPTGETLIKISQPPMASILEGQSRPGHFVGMLTVVNKLLNITNPVATFFGEKDFQQLVLVQQMVADLNLPIQVIGVPTVRDEDGLALSSRNKRLTAKERQVASQIPATLSLIKHSLTEGHTLTKAKELGLEYLTKFPELRIDYLELRNEQLGIPTENESVRALIAVQIGELRLIDNMTVKDQSCC